MNRELQILVLIDENESITQRELAKLTDSSLGTINNILQKMINEEVIELLQVETRQVCYFLTEKGKQYKADAYRDEIVACYRTIAEFKRGIKEKISYQISMGVDNFFLYGKDDDIFRLIRMSLIELKRNSNIEYEVIDNIPTNINKKSIVVIWDNDIIDNRLIKQNKMLYLFT